MKRKVLARDAQTVLFLHLPKTAGTTLHRIMMRQYERASIYVLNKATIAKLKALAPEERTKYRLMWGHIPFGLHELLPQPSVYITLLRDPIDRAISNYYFYEVDGLEKSSRAPTPNKTLTLAALQHSRMPEMFDNLQTRLLSGNRDVTPGECSREMLERARQNLQERFVVGLVERFDESVLLFQNAFGWRAPYYAKGMVTRSRPRRRTLSPDIMDWLLARHQLDLELYAFGKDLFGKQIAAQPPHFMTQVEKFRRVNKIVGRAFETYSRASWKLGKILNT